MYLYTYTWGFSCRIRWTSATSPARAAVEINDAKFAAMATEHTSAYAWGKNINIYILALHI